MFASQVTQLFIHITYFIIIARSLGAEQYGMFASVTALVAVFAPFSGLGSGDILVKNVARDHASFNQYWGNGLFIIFVSSAFLLGVTMVATFAIFSKTVPILLVLCVAIADLFFAMIHGMAGYAFSSFLQFKKSAQFGVLFQICRLAAALTLVSLSDAPSVVSWAFLYLLSSAVAVFIEVIVVYRKLGPPKLMLSIVKPELFQRLFFSASLSAASINNNIDKTMLYSLSSSGATGLYAAAYRIIDAAFLPIRSLLSSTYPRFFQHGRAGLKGSFRYGKRILPFSALYGMAAGVGLFLLAPFVPFLLGADYKFTVEAIRWLAPLPFLKSVHYFLADSLTGAGFQGVRTAALIGVAIFNVLMNFWLIPLYSWRGAAWASLASDSILIVGFLGSLLILQMKGSKQNLTDLP